MTTIRLTAAQALVRWLSLQQAEDGSRFIEGVWAIFGHGNVAGLGEALHAHRDVIPTWRGQNEQTMAHAAIAYAKANHRRKAMAVTSSIGPGATNMVTAAALAHVNRLPVLFIPGDVFANRAPDPVLQQISPALNVDKVTIPILLIHGKDDTVVPLEQSRIMESALQKAGKPVEVLVMEGEDHWLSRGDTRLQMLNSVVAFLERHNPPK